MNDGKNAIRPWRRRSLSVGLMLLAAVLAVRAVDVQILDSEFLQDQGDARYLRTVSIPAHRGMITDRNGEPLAISAPVDSVWANPRVVRLDAARQRELARLLGLTPSRLGQRLADREREFVWLRRHVSPDTAARVRALGIDGVFLRQESRRFYPAGEVTAQVVGITDVDERGQEGLELALDERLRGVPGLQRVLKDRIGRVVEQVALVRPPRPGEDLALSLDRRIQYLAYRELKAAVRRHHAQSGSLVILDVASGEILAMVNQPSVNPNDRRGLRSEALRNRAVTDLFEPGSTIKPFVVAAALASGRYRPDTPIDTRPGTFRVGRKVIHDVHDQGLLDVARVIQKSSNVGIAKIALSLPRETLWETYNDVGLGLETGSGFPGEPSGRLPFFSDWDPLTQATLAFGYGMAVTPLQLAQAYAVLAADGLLRPPSFLRLDRAGVGRRVLDVDVVRRVRAMMEGVVSAEGTARRAAVPAYRVAGKTGTVRKSGVGGYREDRYVAWFAGMAPASRPRLVAVVVIDEPQGDYYGGQVAAPVFARVMAGALRLLDVPPDGLEEGRAVRLAEAGR